MTGTWTEFSASQLSGIGAQESLDAMVLLSNGVVLGHTTINQTTQDPSLCTTTCSGTKWYQLSPDQYGQYNNSSWSPYVPGSSNTYIAHAAQERDLFSSQVLPDGRLVVVAGEIYDYQTPSAGIWCLGSLSAGEYSTGNYAEIYNPTTNQWSSVSDPYSGSNKNFLGCAVPLEILPTDTSGTHDEARVLVTDSVLNSSNRWVPGTHVLNVQIGGTTSPCSPVGDPCWTAGGTPQGDSGIEDGWVLAAGNSTNNAIASVDTNTPGYENVNYNTAEYYNPSAGTWAKTSLTQQLSECSTGSLIVCEIGPAVRLPSQNKAWFLGATGHTEYFNESSSSWSTGLDLPNLDPVLGSFIHGDHPAAVLPNGHVLFLVDNSSNVITADEFDPDPAPGTFAAASLPSDVNSDSDPLYTRMLVLPTGQVLLSTTYHVTGGCSPCTQQEQVYLYTPDGSPQSAWQPTIASVTSLGGATYQLTGTQFNGVSEGGAFGDDAGASTNYPIVRLTKTGGAHVYYARTHDWDHTGVATGSTTVSTQFDLPSGMAAGTYTVEVITNGIVSSNSMSLLVGGFDPPPGPRGGKPDVTQLALALAPASGTAAPVCAGPSASETRAAPRGQRPAVAAVAESGARAVAPMLVPAVQHPGEQGPAWALAPWAEPADDVLASWGLLP